MVGANKLSSRFILLPLLLAITLTNKAQGTLAIPKEARNREFVPGVIMLKDSSEEKGFIADNVAVNARNNSYIYFKSAYVKEHRVSAKKLLGYKYRSKEFESYDNRFYQVLLRGPILSLYCIMDTGVEINPESEMNFSQLQAGNARYNAIGSSMHNVKNYKRLFLKKAGLMVKVKKRRFAKRMADYFKDCKGLSEKILNKEYTYNHLVRIVQVYNHCMLAKQ